MSAAYSKEFLVNAFLWRYRNYPENQDWLRKMAEEQYDKQGKDTFRAYASLDAAAIRKYKEALKTSG